MGSLKGAGGAGGRGGQETFQEFPVRRGPSKEPLGRSGARVIDGTTLKWRAEGAGNGGPLLITECPLCLATRLTVWWTDRLWEVECVLWPNPDRETINSSSSLSHYFPVKASHMISDTHVKSLSTNVSELNLQIQWGHLCWSTLVLTRIVRAHQQQDGLCASALLTRLAWCSRAVVLSRCLA